MITLELLREKAPEIRAIAEKYGAENIRVFGSVARGEAREDSDVDLLVDWKGKSLFDRIEMKFALESLLKANVDVIVAKLLHWTIKDSVFKEARPL
jgi:uncharacterized protein